MSHDRHGDRGDLRFFRHMDLIAELNAKGDELSREAAEAIQWLREEMIDPAEYMRVSGERSRLMSELISANEAQGKVS